jgi:hypothetical protein
MLPTSLNGSAFCLGTVDEGSAKVLTAQEAREARLKRFAAMNSLSDSDIGNNNNNS